MKYPLLALLNKKRRTLLLPILTFLYSSVKEGAVDDLKSLLAMRDRFNEKGFTFYIHVDAAWGGYFASVLRTEKGGTIPMVWPLTFFRFLSM
jgi:hypothetical protein